MLIFGCVAVVTGIGEYSFFLHRMISRIHMGFKSQNIFLGDFDLWDDFRDREIFFYNIKSNGTTLARARRPAERNCMCTSYQCDCCAGLKLPRLKVDRQFCTKMNYNRYTSLLRMGIIMNGKEVAQKTIYGNDLANKSKEFIFVTHFVSYSSSI